MLNIKSVVDGGFLSYQAIKELNLKHKKTMGIIFENHLVDIPVIEEFFERQPIVGVRKPFAIGEEKFSLVMYAKSNKGKENIQTLANMTIGETKDLSKLKEMKLVVESENPSIQTLLEANGVQVKDVYYAANKENVQELSKKGHLKLVDFRELGYVKNEEKYRLHNLILRGEEGKGCSEEEFLEDALKIKDYSYEIRNLNIKWTTFKSEEQHLPFWEDIKKYNASEAFFNVINNDIIKDMSEKEMRAAAMLFDIAVSNTVSIYGTDNAKVFYTIVSQLELVFRKKYTLYFLVVNKIYQLGRQNNIEFGIGRGSVCGFLLAYVLRFIEIDALEFDLLPERFISDERMDNVDIDIDVSQRDRDKLILLIQKEFGKEFVAQVVTKSKVGFKNARKEYLKYVKVNPKRLKELEVLKPENFSTIEEFLEFPEARNLYEKSKDMRDLMETCFMVKDSIKSLSRHGAALLLSDIPIADLVPVVDGENGVLMTQYTNDEGALEKAGLIKIDILGLRNVDIIADVRKAIVENNTNIDPEKIIVKYDDEKTLKLYREGKTIGVFQMESYSARKAAMEMEISSFKDVVALNAMNRPGPKEFIPEYAARKKDPTKRPRLEGLEVVDRITDETHGIIVYQEQINKIAIEFAGYQPSVAENFRRAISHKDAKGILNEKARFVEKAIENGATQENAEKIYEYILKFIEYGFNKSHSVGYGKMSFITAYYKANFPVEYMTELLNSVVGKRDKMALYINDAVEMGIEVRGLDINKSQDKFVIEDGAIRVPFQIINGLGDSFANKFVKIRGNRSFASYMEYRKFAKEAIDSFPKFEDFVRVGGFDSLEGQQSRSVILADVKGQTTAALTTVADDINAEMEVMGVVLNKKASNFHKMTEFVKENKEYKFGVITRVIEEPDVKGRMMGKIELTKFNGYTDKMVVFSRDWTKLKESIKQGEIYLVKNDKNVIKEVRQV